MLLGEQFGRRHQRYLSTGFDCGQRSQRGDDGLARANVALNQTQHRHTFTQVTYRFGADARLRCGRRKWQRSEESLAQVAIAAQHGGGLRAQAIAQLLERQMLGEQFLECQALLRRVHAEGELAQIGVGWWPVDIEQRIAQRVELVAAAQRCRQQLEGFVLGQLFQRTLDQTCKPLLAEPFGGWINRRQTFFYIARRIVRQALVLRMHHFQTVLPAPHFAKAAQPCADKQLAHLCAVEMEKPQDQGLL